MDLFDYVWIDSASVLSHPAMISCNVFTLQDTLNIPAILLGVYDMLAYPTFLDMLHTLEDDINCNATIGRQYIKRQTLLADESQ